MPTRDEIKKALIEVLNENPELLRPAIEASPEAQELIRKQMPTATK